MSPSKSGALPSIFVPEKEKDETYHRNYVQAIVSRSIYSGYSERRALMDECVNFYLGLQNGEEFEFLQKAEDGEVLPAKWMDFNKIAVKIDLLIGELSKRSYKIDVRACNKAAQSRRLDEKNRLLTEMRFAPIAQELEMDNGLPLQSDEAFVPETAEQLDIYMDKGYKETSELVMREVLKYLRKVHNWDYERIAVFRDLLIMGIGFFKNQMDDGLPHLERVDPRYMIWDTNAKDDFLSDSTYWGEMSYMSLGEITRRFKISRKELEAAFKNYNEFSRNPQSYSQFTVDFGFIDRTSRFQIFKNEGGEIRALVAKAYWQDIKDIKRKVSPDNYGQEHLKKVGDDEEGENINKTPIQIWRTGTLIGGVFLKDYGPMKNQDRSVDNIATTTPPYIALVPNYLNGAIVSKVHRLKPLQNLKNIAMYRVQLDIARSGGKGFIYDVAQLPKGWDIHTALKYLRSTGIAYIDSSVEGAGTFNQFKEIDMGLSQSVNQFIELSMFLDREMDSISGINEARQGLIQNASQAVGVTNSALLQSSLSTEMYFAMFAQMFTKAMNKQAGLAKIAWAGKERFSPIIGDVGVNFLEQDIELDLNDYNVFVEEVPQSMQDQQMFYNLVLTGIQTQQLPFMLGMKLLMEKDVEEAMNILEVEMKRTEQQQMDQQSQLMQAEQQQQQAQQQQAQQEMALKAQGDQMKTQADMQKIVTQGKFDLHQGAVGFQQQLALKKIDAAIQAQKMKEQARKKAQGGKKK
jgi:hypothetical protein